MKKLFSLRICKSENFVVVSRETETGKVTDLLSWICKQKKSKHFVGIDLQSETNSEQWKFCVFGLKTEKNNCEKWKF